MTVGLKGGDLQVRSHAAPSPMSEALDICSPPPFHPDILATNHHVFGWSLSPVNGVYKDL